MTKTTRSLAALSLMALLVTACSTTPEPVEETPVAVEAPVEFVPAPDPAPRTITPAPGPTVMLDPNQPLPGSIEDFAFQT
ncbi:MAG: hypothetical protein WBF53_04680, partial [Litorimonas sp.]